MADVATLSVLLQARDQLSAPLGKMQKKLNDVSATARKMGMAFTAMGGAITGAAALSVKTFVTMGDEIQKMALRTGFGTESLSELSFALKIAGSDVKSFETGIKRMASFVLDAKDGLSTSTDALDRLGISIAQLEGLSPEKAFDLLSGAIAALPDELEKSALAQDVFGRAGTKLLPLLNEGARGIKALRQEARDLGVVFDQDAANAAAELSDTMTRMKASLTGVSLTVGEILAPVLEDLVKKMTATIQKIRAWTEAHPELTKFITLAAVAVGGLMLVLGPLLLILPGIATAIGAVGVAFTIATGPIGLTAIAIAAVIIILRKMGKSWTEIADLMIKGVNLLTFNFRMQFALMADGVALLLRGFRQADLADKVTRVADALRRGIPPASELAEQVKGLVGNFDLFNIGGSKVAETIKEEVIPAIEDLVLATVALDAAMLDVDQQIMQNTIARLKADREGWDESTEIIKEAFAKQTIQMDTAFKTFDQMREDARMRANQIAKRESDERIEIQRNANEEKKRLLDEEKEARLQAVKDMIAADQRLRESIVETVKRWAFATSEAGKLKLTIDNVGAAFVAAGGSVELAEQALINVGDATGSVEAFLGALGLSALEARQMIDDLSQSLDVLEKTAKRPLAEQRFQQIVGQRREVAAQIQAEANRRFATGRLIDVPEGERLAKIAEDMRAVIHAAIQAFQQGVSTPGFAHGGVVPGPIGAPVLATVHGGETILPSRGGNGTMTRVLNLALNFNAPTFDARAAIGQAVRDIENEGGFDDLFRDR